MSGRPAADPHADDLFESSNRASDSWQTRLFSNFYMQ